MVMLMQQDPRSGMQMELAKAMMQKGLQSGEPIRHWTQSAAKLANALLGAKMTKDLGAKEQERQKQFQTDLMSALQGEGGQYGPEPPLLDRLSRVPGIDQNQLAGLQIQQALQPKPRDPLADYEAKRIIDQKYPKPESDFDRYIKTLQAEKLQSDLDTKRREQEELEKAGSLKDTEWEQSLDTYKNIVPEGISKKDLEDKLDLIYGREEFFMPEFARSQEGVDLKANIDLLKSRAELAQAGKLKGQGPISEGERAILKQGVSILSNEKVSPKAAAKAVDDIMGILAGSLGKSFTPTSATNAGSGKVDRSGWSITPND